jgi:hypothetical protein
MKGANMKNELMNLIKLVLVLALSSLIFIGLLWIFCLLGLLP